MDKLYDVVVVGAGAAGSTAAFELGQAGKKVIVLEKEKLPRYKACGGGIATRVFDQFPFSFEEVIESQVSSVSYALGDVMVKMPVPRNAIALVMRDRLDSLILSHAKSDVRDETQVVSLTENDDHVRVRTANGETVMGRYLIGADGANSLVARLAGLRRGKTMAAALEAEVQPPAHIVARFAESPLFIFGELSLGYLWIFPKARHLSVGVAALHPKRGELQRALQRAMAHYGISLDSAKIHGHPVPIYLRKEPIANRRILLVGDAAGLADPFTGEGIRYGIKSGRLAAQAIISGKPKSYTRNVDRAIRSSLFWGIPLAVTFYRFPRQCFAWGVRNPAATRAFLDLLSDRTTYRQVIFRLFGSLPGYLIRQKLNRLNGR